MSDPRSLESLPVHRQAWWLRAPLHAYVLPLTPKTLLETLCVVESALHALERERPGFNAGGTVDSHLEKIRLVMDECERMRPTGPDGKHGSRHTSDCGCTDNPLRAALDGPR